MMKTSSDWKSLPLALIRISALWAAMLHPGRAPGAEPLTTVVSINWVRHYHNCDSLTAGKDAVSLTRGDDVLLFSLNSRRFEFNGTAIWLSEPIQQRRGRAKMLKADVDNTIAPLLKPADFLVGRDCSIIVLDAGHGGRDKGVTDRKQEIEEKAVTLQLANMVRDILEENEVTVRMTRNNDEWIGLDERSDLAEGYGADLFISIHLNGATNTAATGVETHILPPAGLPSVGNPAFTSESDAEIHSGNNHNGANMILGHALQRRLVAHTAGCDRGVRRSRFQVLRNAPCPAALVECGFLTNEEEAEKFNNPDYCEQIARAIADGIMDYVCAVKRARDHGNNSHYDLGILPHKAAGAGRL